MRKLILTTLILMAVAPVGAAQADLQSEYTEAVAWWGQSPTWCASVDLSYQMPNPDDAEAAHADIPTRYGDECGVVMDSGMPVCAEVEVMRHEVGHLLGYGHSTDPASVMYGGSKTSWPNCAAEEAAETRATMVAQLVEYEAWMGREVRRCRHRKVRRKLCFHELKDLKAEVRTRRAELG